MQRSDALWHWSAWISNIILNAYHCTLCTLHFAHLHFTHFQVPGKTQWNPLKTDAPEAPSSLNIPPGMLRDDAASGASVFQRISMWIATLHFATLFWPLFSKKLFVRVPDHYQLFLQWLSGPWAHSHSGFQFYCSFLHCSLNASMWWRPFLLRIIVWFNILVMEQ